MFSIIMLDTKFDKIKLQFRNAMVPAVIKREYQAFIKNVTAMIPISKSAFKARHPARGNVIVNIDVSSLGFQEIGIINVLGKNLQQRTRRSNNEPPVLVVYKNDVKREVRIDLLDV